MPAPNTSKSSPELQQLINQAYITTKRRYLGFSALRSAFYGLFISLGMLLVALAGFFVVMRSSSPSAIIALSGQLSFAQVLTGYIGLGIFSALVAFVFLLWRSTKQSAVNQLSPYSFLLHLNRTHNELEESAQLCLVPEHELSLVQSMQLKRIRPFLQALLVQESSSYLLQFAFKAQAIKVVITLIVSVFLLHSGVSYLNSISAKSQSASFKANSPQENEPALKPLDKLIVSVAAPSYTKQAPFEQQALNLEVLEGSSITWTIPLPESIANDYDFSLTLSNGKSIEFAWSKGKYKAQHIADSSVVYSISQSFNDTETVSDISTLSVLKDAKPFVQIYVPEQITTEFAKNALPTMRTEVEIYDDYGLKEVKIIASVAKGSGEAVKFRDEEFIFDEIIQRNERDIYIKNWDLSALNMAPGDELYFSVFALDNKPPEGQSTTSSTRILRWLDTEDKAISAQGIVIDFMPEYLKSQRQIIIETEELIAQKERLSTQEFTRISRALAIDQQDLKESYGQYLGDEVESGVLREMEDGMRAPALADAEHDHDHDHDHDNTQQEVLEAQDHDHAHEHAHNYDSSAQNDISGYSEIIERFGHNHGSADVGFIKTFEGQINPKVLMKRALAQMWDAELNLQLSQPELALPYEKQALDYLNRAKQAERIYVKRLGFEPPPVTEERRYAGKLNEILTYEKDISIELPNSQIDEMKALIFILNNRVAANTTSLDINASERAVLDTVTAILTEQLDQEPKWLSHVATLKEFQLHNSFSLDKCENCMATLISQLHSVLPKVVAYIKPPSLPYSQTSPITRAYAEALNQQSNVQAKQYIQSEQKR